MPKVPYGIFLKQIVAVRKECVHHVTKKKKPWTTIDRGESGDLDTWFNTGYITEDHVLLEVYNTV